ncbi:hypothetical protein SBD_6218 [Streptomyces bottropensis ATCC 25435]|uniref:Uncharacterized protein n=1 Tax=Streptomyces bottropensis ATCC 25435 TaxID=1054862 RepID=M3DA20_9ACTN|nr:hypothetical protein SBD_6218 [Streptomyces bottropensis ATCC 25435]
MQHGGEGGELRGHVPGPPPVTDPLGGHPHGPPAFVDPLQPDDRLGNTLEGRVARFPVQQRETFREGRACPRATTQGIHPLPSPGTATSLGHPDRKTHLTHLTCENVEASLPGPSSPTTPNGRIKTERRHRAHGPRHSTRKDAPSCRTPPAGPVDAPAPPRLDPRPRPGSTPAPSGTGPHEGRDRCRTKRFLPRPVRSSPHLLPGRLPVFRDPRAVNARPLRPAGTPRDRLRIPERRLRQRLFAQLRLGGTVASSRLGDGDCGGSPLSSKLWVSHRPG